jgi:hypothetical protein
MACVRVTSFYAQLERNRRSRVLWRVYLRLYSARTKVSEKLLNDALLHNERSGLLHATRSDLIASGDSRFRYLCGAYDMLATRAAEPLDQWRVVAAAMACALPARADALTARRRLLGAALASGWALAWRVDVCALALLVCLSAPALAPALALPGSLAPLLLVVAADVPRQLSASLAVRDAARWPCSRRALP